MGGVLFLCVSLQVLTLAEEELRVAACWSLGETRLEAMESGRAFVPRGLTVLVAPADSVWGTSVTVLPVSIVHGGHMRVALLCDENIDTPAYVTAIRDSFHR